MSKELERLEEEERGWLHDQRESVEVVDGELIEDDRLRIPITKQEAYDEELLARFRDRVNDVVDDAVECFTSRRELVNYPFRDEYGEPITPSHPEYRNVLATVRTIARWGARLMSGQQINPEKNDGA